MTVTSTLVIGNPRAGSRTAAAAAQFAAAVRAALAEQAVAVAEPHVVDLAELVGPIPVLPSPPAEQPRPLAEALAAVRSPDLLIVASPTFKGAYSGLVKLYFDMLPMDGLAGTVAVPMMTAGWERHRGAGDQFLAPLLVELGATVPVPSFSVVEAEFGDLRPVLDAWITAHAGTVAAVVRSRHDAFAGLPTWRAGQRLGSDEGKVRDDRVRHRARHRTVR